MNRFTRILSALCLTLLAACGTTRAPKKYVTSPMGCVAEPERPVGAVTVTRCTAWEFGPSIEQQKRFDRAGGSAPTPGQ